jgi:hypothetical protein
MATVSMAVSDASGDSAVIEWLIRAIRIMGNDALQGNGNAQPRPPARCASGLNPPGP